jgi:hypothetical protein
MLLMAGAAIMGGGSAALAQLPGSAAPAGNGVGSAFELTFWQSIATSEDRAQYEAYLTQYPAGTFSALARAKIAAIDRARGVAAPAAPVPAPVAAPAPSPAPVAAEPAAPAPASAPVAAAAPAPAAAPGGDPFAKLAAARAAAAAGGAGGTMEAAPAGAVLPMRPTLAAVPTITLPDRFCSAEDRNRFHDTIYKPAVEIAEQNNKTTIAYLNALQADYDARSSRRETEAANSLAKEAAAYKPVAQEAYEARDAFVGMFSRLMAVPVTSCR